MGSEQGTGCDSMTRPPLSYSNLPSPPSTLSAMIIVTTTPVENRLYTVWEEFGGAKMLCFILTEMLSNSFRLLKNKIFPVYSFGLQKKEMSNSTFAHVRADKKSPFINVIPFLHLLLFFSVLRQHHCSSWANIQLKANNC